MLPAGSLEQEPADRGHSQEILTVSAFSDSLQTGGSADCFQSAVRTAGLCSDCWQPADRGNLQAVPEQFQGSSIAF